MKLHKDQGYTLIEVLVALFIFAIATYLVSVALIESQNNEKIIKAKTKRFIEVQRGITLGLSDIIQAVPKKLLEQGRPIGSFKTDEQSLQFVRLGQMNPNYEKRQSSLKKIIYSFENNQWLRQTLDLEESGAEPEVLLSGVSDLTWTFYDKDGKSYEYWPPTQDWQDQIPLLVRFQITLEDLGPIERIVSLSGERIRYATTTP